MKVNFTSFGLARSESKGSDDSFGIRSWDETVLAVLADGAGAARGAREASSRIVESLLSYYEVRPQSWSPPRALLEFTRLINGSLHQESMARYESPEMVSTLAAAVIEGNRLFGLNVGDSRVYLLRQGNFSQLSTDHTVNERGFRHVLKRAMGLADVVEPDAFETELCDGDLLFLCSDGVSNVLGDDSLASKLSHRSAARAIVQHAREHATNDNLDDMSAIVIEIIETGKLKVAAELPLTIPETLKKGDVIDGYELVRPFQQSERVWLAARDGARWTLKFAPLEARENEAVLNLFIKETWNATRLDAPFFVKAFIPENATTRFYVMEFVEAPSLRSWLRARPLDVNEAVSLARFLLDAGAHLLQLDLVHGDIKPENILVINEYDRLAFKLVDLGSATEIFSVTSRAGTASYLAPERFQQAPISERTEIFAIGATLYQALTGVLPFGEIERFQTPHFHSPKPPAVLNPNIPPWLDAIILRSIALDVRQRFQHYSAFSFELTNPDKVEPFFQQGLPLLDRDPLLFYKSGFWILLASTLFLLFRLFAY